jgi:hypothetical protein
MDFIPMLLHHHVDFLELCDGFLLSGDYRRKAVDLPKGDF